MTEMLDLEQVRATEKEDWEQVRELEDWLQQGQSLQLTDMVRELLRRTAMQVALSFKDTENGLQSPAHAALLVKVIRRRIHEGAVRQGQAMVDAAVRGSMGDIRGGLEVLKRALEAEAVPYYRGAYEALIDSLETRRT